ncbi:hypothetical protein CAP36_14200 [Chitinophagaceae bacterium IBVUCB2]|nr:hypothetical protein CAP36_14200 [Chitinophagaceae bacterium IBVUCB2]
MKKYFFIPAIILLIAQFITAQPPQKVGTVTFHSTDQKKITIGSFAEWTHLIQLPADGAVSAQLQQQLLFSGHVKKQKLHGAWESFYPGNKKLDSGYLRNGVPDGEWKRWDSSGHLLAIRQYDAGKLQQVKEEMRLAHPKKYFYTLSALYKTDRLQALYAISAAYSFSFNQQKRSMQSLLQMVENNSNTANSYIPVFNECLHHGLYMNFFAGGIARDSGYYKNGLRDGVWLHRNSAAGYYFIGSYKNGSPVKEWKQYDEDGRLYAIIFYNKEGREEWTKKIRR